MVNVRSRVIQLRDLRVGQLPFVSYCGNAVVQKLEPARHCRHHCDASQEQPPTYKYVEQLTFLSGSYGLLSSPGGEHEI